MDISSVKPQTVQPTPPPQRAVDIEQARVAQAKSVEENVNKTSEAKPAPVINTQGQTTGRLINTTA